MRIRTIANRSVLRPIADFNWGMTGYKWLPDLAAGGLFVEDSRSQGNRQLEGRSRRCPVVSSRRSLHEFPSRQTE